MNINIRDFVEEETAGAATPGAFTKLQNEEIGLWKIEKFLFK